MRQTATFYSLRSCFAFLLGLALLVVSTNSWAQTSPSTQGLVADATEIQALRAFYASTNGSQWFTHTNWPETNAAWDNATIADASTWYGVSVSGGDVVGLSLFGNGLTGSLPPEIGDLAALQALSFGRSHFSTAAASLSGSLPKEMGKLHQLQTLDITYSEIGGLLPAELGNMTALRSLNLVNNNFSGRIPKELGQLQNLTYLNLENYYRPTFAGHRNAFTEGIPPELGQLTNLTFLALDMNPLGGSIPPELGKLQKLTFLELDDNHLSGTVPAELLRLPNLTVLILGSSNVGYSDPNTFTSLPGPSVIPVPANLALVLSYNQFEFGKLEPYFDGPGHMLTRSDSGYKPQTLPTAEQTVTVVQQQPLTLPSGIGGAHSHYQWQVEQSGTWQNLPAASMATYQILHVITADAGRYRCQVTNEWVTGITLFSPTFKVQVSTHALPPSDPSDDLDRNWSFSRTYDLDGTITSEGKQFVDALGRPTQSQSKNLAEHHVFASQSLNNMGGVAVLSTLSAPTNNQEFKFKTGFVTAAGKDYAPVNFEKSTANSPDPLDETTIGTLGYYYSPNNMWEPAIAATHNPYALTEPMPGPLGGVRRAAGPGDAFALGAGHESKGRDFPLLNELDHYSQLRALFVPGSPTPSLRGQGVKIVSSNPNGVETISFANREGQALASCLSGDQYPTSTLTGSLSVDPTNRAGNPVYQDIHVAASATPTAVTVTAGTNDSFVVINLLQNPLVETRYTGAQTLSLTPGFYRLQATAGSLSFAYQVHYGDFSYTYYDDAGHNIASIAPKGVAEVLPNGLLTNALYRIRAAQSAPLTTTRGTFTSDQYYSPTPGNTSTTSTAIAGTTDQALYQAERYGQQFAYALPVPNGTYTVVLHFAETYWQLVGQRVFNVSLEKALVLDHYDITEKVGPFTATTETFPVTVTDGVLNIDFTSAIAGGVDNPKISALEVLTTTPSSSQPLQYVTRNTYDTSGRLLATESTDEGRSEYVYAQDGRIRFSQSALQRGAGRFSYSNYDLAGRVLESGEYTQATDLAQGVVFENMLTASPVANSVLQSALLEERVTAGPTSNGSLDVARCAQRAQVWYDLPQTDAALGNRQQEFVLGAVAKTSKGETTSWYSYNDLGQLTWLVQQAPVVGIKTVDYTYDAAGNVIQVAYQKDQADAFYHYNSYDANQRLIQVQTSPDGVTRTLQASYSYYLHGPLKRVETAGNLQGTDYTYTVQGWLKGINSANRHFDGDSPTANGFTKDLFGLNLDYFSGDYRSAQATMATPTIADAPATRYDGSVRSAAWFTTASPLMRQHVFTYDTKGQLKQADFGELVPGATPEAVGTFVRSPTRAFEEGNLDYDLNGNLRTLRRRDEKGLATDDFTYQYPTGSNKLTAVNNPAGTAVLDYDYDATGQMTRQRDEKGQRYLTYDVTGKVTGVYRDAAHQQPLVVFTYNDRGFRASKASYDPTTYQLQKTTYSVRDMAGSELATYTLDATTASSTLQRSEVPLYGASRLGTLTRLDDGTLDYRYELNDQLGNARVIFHKPTTSTYTATMEPGAASQEEQAFTNVALTRYATAGHNNSASVSLLGITSGQHIGPSKTLTVQKGDTITFTAYAWLTAAVAQPGGPHHLSAFVVAPLIGVGALGTGASSAGSLAPPAEVAPPTKQASLLTRLSAGLGITLGAQQAAQLTAAPQAITGSSGSAYLHFIIRDEQGTVVRDDYQEVNGSTPGSWQQLQMGLRLAQGGTVALSVETDGAIGPDVYFDDVQVDYTTSTIVQEQHTYAYGAPMLGLNYVVGTKKYRHGYQGQYAEKDEETGTDDFELRNYDARIGRWTAPDPAGQFHSPYVGVGNNPISTVDPDGGWGFANGFTSFLANIGIGAINAAGKYSIDFARTYAKGVT